MNDINGQSPFTISLVVTLSEKNIKFFPKSARAKSAQCGVTLFHKKKCEPGWIRTIDTCLKRAVLYQAELRALIFIEVDLSLFIRNQRQPTFNKNRSRCSP